MPAGEVVWLTVAAGALVLLGAALAQLARAARDAKRLAGRIGGYARLPVVAALERAGDDAARLENALGTLEPLLARAQIALATIKRGPLPPEFSAAFGALAELRRLRG